MYYNKLWAVLINDRFIIKDKSQPLPIFIFKKSADEYAKKCKEKFKKVKVRKLEPLEYYNK